MIAEQTSHHPPVTCFYMESKDFEVTGYNQVELSFGLSGFAVIPKGERIIKLKNPQETYVIEFPTANLRNIVFGHKHIYYSGYLRVTN